MEFKYRAGDHRPPPHSSSFGYFSEEAKRAWDPRHHHNQEILKREMMKQQIRAEMVAEEVALRRLLEAEVRREMMVEVEMARRGGEWQFFQESMGRLQVPLPNYHHSDYRLLEDRMAFRCSCCRMMFDQQRQFPVMPEAVLATPPIEDKLIILAKPDPDTQEAKRKVATPPAQGDALFRYSGSKRKAREEWSCALCQVTAANEKVFYKHLNGRKHKAKTAGLKHHIVKKPSAAPLPKRIAKSANIITGAELQRKVEGASLQVISGRSDSMEKIKDRKVGSKKEDMTEAKENQGGNNLKQNETLIVQGEDKKQRKSEFWCETCNIIVYSEKVVEAHKNGKKHQARLRGLGRKGEAAKDSKIMSEEENKERAKDSVVMAEEANKKAEVSEVVAEETNMESSKAVEFVA
ncbi:hypothetical protein Tsubulata_029259 [Turnera subulata]|uniref:U1-type domain-containing protein n=1 Tax=Turnera subulata TaxID=218843 RepID=A0A9Q0JIR1_9ROSI|nr:hypothetical protein Tsubulata_029259 [Turnera subulata]